MAAQHSLLLGLLAFLVAMIAALGWWQQKEASSRVDQELYHSLQEQLASRGGLLDEALRRSRDQVRFVLSTPPIQGMVRARANDGSDPMDGTPFELWRRRLETIVVAFMENNSDILAINYIGLEDGGRELARVERRQGSIRVASAETLQRRGDEAAFQALLQLPQGGVFVSDFNLRREHGEIIIPPEPAFLAAVPVYDMLQRVFGVVTIEYDAHELFRRITRDLPKHLDLYLLNEERDYLVHPEDGRAFAFATGDSPAVAEGADSVLQLGGHTPLSLMVPRAADEEPRFFMESVHPLSRVASDRYLVLQVAAPQSYRATRIYEESTRPLLLLAGVFLALLVMLAIQQVSARRGMLLGEAQARCQAIVDGSVDAIVGMNTQGRIESWNAGAEETFGFSEEQALGRRPTELFVGEDDRKMVEQGIARALQGEAHPLMRLDAVCRDGEPIKVSLSLAPIRTSGQGIVGVSAIARDVTELYQAQQLALEMNSTLEQQVFERTLELEQARNLALSASEAKSNFVANVSHEIRTPLNGIIGMLQLIRRASSRELQTRYLGMAESSASALAALINDVLDLSKIEAGKLEITRGEYDLLDVVSDTCTAMSMRARDKGLELIIDASGVEVHQLLGDAHRLRQILVNLLENALKFTERGWVKVSLRTVEHAHDQVEIRCAIQDTGVGIADDKQQAIFEAFSQEDASVTRRFGGTGLGLSITRQLCRLMGGDIELHSEKGCGSTFEFSLFQETHGRHGDPFADMVLTGLSFLLVDPLPARAESLSRQLRSWGATRVEHSDGLPLSQALADADHFDIVIVDETLWEAWPPATEKDPVAVMLQQLEGHPLSEEHAPGLFTLLKPVTPVELASLLRRARFTHGPVPEWREKREATNRAMPLPVGKLSCAGARVLVVDDNHINQQVAVGMLTDLGAEVETAWNGREAIEILAQREGEFQLIFMDAQMPILDGYSASREIRAGGAGEAAREVPIIAMTASAMAGDRERCMIAGMDDYVTKPLDFDALEARAAYWLQHDGSSLPAILRPPTAVKTGVSLSHNARQALDGEPVWDRDCLLRNVNFRAERVPDLIRLFLNLFPERVALLTCAMRSRDFDAVASEAHCLKGSAASLGASRLHRLCLFVEQTARSGQADVLDLCPPMLEREATALIEALNLGFDADAPGERQA
ncbi:ATP-binding protein [Mangrovimicrobium sediminis]|nr:ATP-binding protein [Haliea sp. SAOS-164]